MTLLGFFTEDAYDFLMNAIPQNVEKYRSDEEWLEDFFKGNPEYYRISQSVDVGVFHPAFTKGKKSDEQKSQEDLDNARKIHEAFKKLNPYQASNKYMWTYLCHSVPEYREYIRDRWMQEERENTIRTRFFVTTSASLINDNALSRLWWYAHLSYDGTASNPYALTEILLMNQTICTDVLDTLNRTNMNRMKGVLLAIRDFKNETGGKGITDIFRECKKYLNHYAAVTTMEYLEPEEIRDIAFGQMIKAYEKKQVQKKEK